MQLFPSNALLREGNRIIQKKIGYLGKTEPVPLIFFVFLYFSFSCPAFSDRVVINSRNNTHGLSKWEGTAKCEM